MKREEKKRKKKKEKKCLTVKEARDNKSVQLFQPPTLQQRQLHTEAQLEVMVAGTFGMEAGGRTGRAGGG